MRIQKVSAGRGAAWINESIELLKSGGKAIWVPALLVGILNYLPNFLTSQIGVQVYLGFPSDIWIQALFGVLMIIFYAGLVLCFDKPNGGYTVFSGFSDGGFARLLPVIALNIALAIIAIWAIWPSMKPVFDAAMSGMEPSTEDAMAMVTGLAKHLLWLIPIGIFLSWITQFAVPLASLRKISGGESIKLALSAISANIPALIVNFFCLMAIVILVCIVLMIPIVLVEAAFAGNQILSSLMVIPLTALLTAIVIALVSGNMLFAYRDVFKQEPEQDVAQNNSEVLL